jgi:two-component system sensor histidine kinase BaeS
MQIGRTLGLQMAAVAALIVIVAIAAVSLISSFNISNSFDNYLHVQVRATAQAYANSLSGQGALSLPNNGLGTPLQVWVMRSDESIAWPDPRSSVWTTTDPQAILPAMRATLLSGVPSEGDLGGSGFLPWLHYSARAYAVEPVKDPTTNEIIGVVAVSSENSVAGAAGPQFIDAVNHALWLGGIGIALLMALLGAWLAQRLVRPVAALTATATSMAEGNLSARAPEPPPNAPIEIEQLTQSFNDMAANLERDVNQLRKHERAQRELLSNVAHELATPLTAIQGFAQALADGMVNDEGERIEISGTIERESARLQRLVDQLRQLTKIESGAQPMDLHLVILPDLIDDTVAVLRAEIERHEMTLRVEIAPDLPPVSADADRLTEVLLNLIDNALHHTPDGGTLTVSVFPEGAMVRVNVDDTGPGIPPGDLDRVFERFYRTDPSRASQTGGTGLGLAIVKSIIEAHGGTIYAENRPEGGARFSFTLPAVPRDSLADAPTLVQTYPARRSRLRRPARQA